MTDRQHDEYPATESNIVFHSEDVDFSPDAIPQLITWIEQIIEQEHCILQAVTFIFCSDNYLLQLNQEYLQHDTLTDIISFPYALPPEIEGDIFISVDRVRENAETFGVSFEQELHRVMIHGVLHFCGYGDKTPEEKERMRSKENAALKLLREADT